MIPQSGKPVLVDFYADWCAPCQWLEPILTQVEALLEGRIEVLKINTEEHPLVASQFHIQSVPTLVLFCKGEVKWRMSGFLFAPELVKILEEHLRDEEVH
jgi:thioredoxin 1